jgi:hypothetical protein
MRIVSLGYDRMRLRRLYYTFLILWSLVSRTDDTLLRIVATLQHFRTNILRLHLSLNNDSQDEPEIQLRAMFPRFAQGDVFVRGGTRPRTGYRKIWHLKI